MISQKGFNAISILIGLFIVFAAGIGGYYLGTLKNSTSNQPLAVVPAVQPSSTPKTKQVSLDLYDQNTELIGFPVYTSALFVSKKYYPPCPGNDNGFANCDLVAYTFETRDDFDQVNSWYKSDPSNSGWVCKGGAGGYVNSRSADGTTSCTKGNKTYSLDLMANKVKTSISINIPMSDYNGKFLIP